MSQLLSWHPSQASVVDAKLVPFGSIVEQVLAVLVVVVAGVVLADERSIGVGV